MNQLELEPWKLGCFFYSMVSCILSKTSDVIWKICISQSNGKLSPTSTFLKCETKILMVINGCPVLWWIRRMWMCLLKNSSLNLEKVCISISRAYLCFSSLHNCPTPLISFLELLKPLVPLAFYPVNRVKYLLKLILCQKFPFFGTGTI